MGDSVRLLSRVTRAFVDRSPIDWVAVLSRATASSDRAYVESLWLLSAIRRTTTFEGDGSRVSALVCVVVALAAIQATCAIVVLAGALGLGQAPLARTPQVVLMCAFALASGWLGRATSRDQRTLFLLAWFSTITSLFARSAVTGLRDTSFAAVDVVFRGAYLEAFAPACLWRFALDFPRVMRFTRFDVLARWATAAAWVMGLLLFSINLAAAYEWLSPRAFSYLLRNHPSNAFWHLITFAFIPAVGAILVRSRRAPSFERSRVARFAVALAVGTAPFLLHGVVLAISPGANAWLLRATPNERFWLDAVIVGGLASTPILMTAAVIVDRPFELHALLGRAAVHALAQAIMTALFLTPFAVLSVLLYQRRHSSIAEVVSGAGIVPLILCGLTGCALLAVRARLLDALDRRLSRRATEHHEQLARSLDRVRLARGAREVAVVLQRELRRGTGAQAVALLLPDEAGGFRDQARTMPLLPLDCGLMAILRETTAPIDVSTDGDLWALLPSRDRAWVTSSDIALLAALKHRDDAIAAVIALGSKRRGLPFDRRDGWLITTLVTAAAASWAEHDDEEDRDPLAKVRRASEAAFECPDCGVVTDTASLPCGCGQLAILAALPLQVAGKFTIVRRLGAGGMGIVYLARDTGLDRDVALKTLPELAPGAVARLRDEARAMAAFGHDALATIYGLELWQRTPVLVVEYLPKGTLAQRLAAGPLSPADTIRLGIRLARGLASMHAEGTLHRDLKPSNIGFTAAGAPKLLDFGLALLTDPVVQSRRGMEPSQTPPAGTAAYLPPEAYRGASPGPAFDLWALSVVLLEAVGGANPFAGASRAGTIRRVTSTHGPDLSPGLLAAQAGLSAFFERALDRHPERRFRSASHMLSALETLASR